MTKSWDCHHIVDSFSGTHSVSKCLTVSSSKLFGIGYKPYDDVTEALS